LPPQANWPEDNKNNVDKLIAYLEQQEDLNITKMNWSTGIIICSKR